MPGKVKGRGHERNRLTAAFVANVSKAGRYQDGGGLFLQVDATGGRRWMQRLMVRGKRHDLGIGPAHLVTLADARKAAAANKRAAMEGRDPAAERVTAEQEAAREDAARAVSTFAAVAERVVAKKAQELSNKKAAAQWGSTLATYAFPTIGGRVWHEVTSADVLAVLSPIWTAKPETASRLRGRIEEVLAYAAVLNGRRDYNNPARWRGVMEHLLPSRAAVARVVHHPALSVEDAPRWFAELRKRDGMGARCLEFVALTACRSGEARGATWDEFDLERGVWTLPKDRTKARREHRVPLSPAALDLLRGLPRVEGNPLVFPAPRGGPLSDMTLSATVRRMHAAAVDAARAAAFHDRRLVPEVEKAGFRDSKTGEPAVVHGLRSTFRDWCAAEGIDRELAELALAHVVARGVEGAYWRNDLLERRAPVMAAWADLLAGKTPGKVVRLRARRNVG